MEYIIKTKHCPDCKLEKSFTDFYPNKRTQSGRDSYCKECQLRQRRDAPRTPAQRAKWKRYAQTEKYKAWRKSYSTSARGRAVAKAATARYQEKNRQKVNFAQYVRMSKKQEALDAIKRKSGCYLCKNTHPFVLTFHHMDPSLKKFQIAADKITKATFQEELAKCICLCFNCHSIAHRVYGQKAIIGCAELDAITIQLVQASGWNI